MIVKFILKNQITFKIHSPILCWHLFQVKLFQLKVVFVQPTEVTKDKLSALNMNHFPVYVSRVEIKKTNLS